jgi:hypothetical protein
MSNDLRVSRKPYAVVDGGIPAHYAGATGEKLSQK